MPATSYSYSVPIDVPSGAVSVARLRQEIELSAILTQIDFNAGGITLLSGGALTIWFKDALSSGDKQILDGSTLQAPNSPATAGSILGDHSGLPLPDDPQDVNVTGGSVAVTGTLDGDGKIKSPDGTVFLGDAANPFRTDPTGATTQPVSAATLPLPAGAATETTLASRAADRTSAGAPHATRLTDGTGFYRSTTPADTQPTSSAAASQVDGHSATLGATTDPDTADTVVGRLKKIASVVAAYLRVRIEDGGGSGRLAAVDASNRLLVNPTSFAVPVNTVPVNVEAVSDVPVLEDTLYVVPAGKTLTISRFAGGSEGNSGKKSKVTLYYDPSGVGDALELLRTMYVGGNNYEFGLDVKIDGDGTKAVRLRRERLDGSADEIAGFWSGFRSV